MFDNLAYLWLAVIVVMLVIEAATVSITTSWFALGALFSLIVTSFAPDALLVQVLVFVVVSGLSLWLLRPLVRRYVSIKRTPTNADRIVGQVGVVLEDIDNLRNAGAVSMGGKIWTARSYTGEPIAKGDTVRALFIEGVKIIVEPLPPQAKS